MTIPDDTKDRAIYHTILAEMHRLQGIILNRQTIDDQTTADALGGHFSREQNLTLAKLAEWRSRRPDIYQQASEAFKEQVGASPA